MIVRDVGPHEGKLDSQRKQSESTSTLTRYLFRSDGNSRFECSTDLLTLVSESTGVMHLLSADQVKASES